jgi:hypothetical protein
MALATLSARAIPCPAPAPRRKQPYGPKAEGKATETRSEAEREATKAQRRRDFTWSGAAVNCLVRRGPAAELGVQAVRPWRASPAHLSEAAPEAPCQIAPVVTHRKTEAEDQGPQHKPKPRINSRSASRSQRPPATAQSDSRAASLKRQPHQRKTSLLSAAATQAFG